MSDDYTCADCGRVVVVDPFVRSAFNAAYRKLVKLWKADRCPCSVIVGRWQQPDDPA